MTYKKLLLISHSKISRIIYNSTCSNFAWICFKETWKCFSVLALNSCIQILCRTTNYGRVSHCATCGACIIPEMFANVRETSNVCYVSNLSIYSSKKNILKAKTWLFSWFCDRQKFLWNINGHTSTWTIAKWRKPVSEGIVSWWN